jgi:hypothetical protein
LFIVAFSLMLSHPIFFSPFLFDKASYTSRS